MPFCPLNQDASVSTRVLAMRETTSMTIAWKSRRAGRSANDPTTQASPPPAAHPPGGGRQQPRQREWERRPQDVLLETRPGGRPQGEHAADVGADGLEHDEREVHHPAHPVLEVQRPAGDRVHAEEHQQGQKVVLVRRTHRAATSIGTKPFRHSPAGRTSRMTARMTNATTSLRAGVHIADSSLAMPITTAPTIAPYGWPTLPNTAAATIISRNALPKVKLKLARFSARVTPPSPHRAPEIAHAIADTRSVATPQPRASSGSAAVARSALPIRVYRRTRCRASMLAAATPMITNWYRVRIIPRKCSERPWLSA